MSTGSFLIRTRFSLRVRSTHFLSSLCVCVHVSDGSFGNAALSQLKPWSSVIDSVLCVCVRLTTNMTGYMCLPLILTTAVSEMAHLAVLPPPELWLRRVAARGLLHITTISDGKIQQRTPPRSPRSPTGGDTFFFSSPSSSL